MVMDGVKTFPFPHAAVPPGQTSTRPCRKDDRCAAGATAPSRPALAHPVRPPGEPFAGASEAVIADLNGDGAPEVIFTTYSSGTPGHPDSPAHLVVSPPQLMCQVECLDPLTSPSPRKIGSRRAPRCITWCHAPGRSIRRERAIPQRYPPTLMCQVEGLDPFT
jgi:hypothetical protein